MTKVTFCFNIAINMSSLTKTREIVTQILLKAGSIARKFYFGDKDLEIQSKGEKGVDLVTRADLEVDKFLKERIQSYFPNHSFLTEETAPDNPKRWQEFKKKDNLWVIDPIDGTTNFSRKDPNFAISVALLQKGVVVLGLIYLPILKDFYWAQKGESRAFLNKKPIFVSQTVDLNGTLVVFDWPYDLEKRKKTIEILEKVYSHVATMKCMGSAAADLAKLAKGRTDVHFHLSLKPWDVAAAQIIIEKAGGVITDLKGKTWSPFVEDILAGNPKIQAQILKLLS